MKSFVQSIRALLRLKPAQKLTRDYLVSLVIAVTLALLAGAGIMALCGHHPLDCYGALLNGALGKPRALGNTLPKTVTLCLTGLAMSLAAKAGVFNVGGEGQLYLGAMAAAVVGAQVKGAPAWLVTVLALLVWYLMSRSTIGFEMKLTGENDRFAKYGGISTGKLMLWSMVFSGALCGMVGMLEVFGLHKRVLTTVSNEFYYDGMLVAMIMRYNPFGVIVMSFLFAILSIGGKSMELSAGVSSKLILIVQSIIIFFMAAEGGIRKSFSDRAALRRARRKEAA